MLHRDHSFGVIPICENEGQRQFLLIRHQAGHWGFPKGHREGEETPMEAARRELAEETGLADVELIEAAQFREQYRFTKRSGIQVHKTVTYFLGRVRSGRVDLQWEEVQDFSWGAAEQTRQRLTYAEARQLLDRVVAYLGQTDGA